MKALIYLRLIVLGLKIIYFWISKLFSCELLWHLSSRFIIYFLIYFILSADYVTTIYSSPLNLFALAFLCVHIISYFIHVFSILFLFSFFTLLLLKRFLFFFKLFLHFLSLFFFYFCFFLFLFFLFFYTSSWFIFCKIIKPTLFKSNRWR